MSRVLGELAGGINFQLGELTFFRKTQFGLGELAGGIKDLENLGGISWGN